MGEDRGLVGSDGEVVAAGVDGAVVVSAQEGEVGHVGGALVAPPLHVVGVSPGGGAVTAGEAAVAVADGEGAALGPVDQARGSSAVEVVDDGPVGGAEP